MQITYVDRFLLPSDEHPPPKSKLVYWINWMKLNDFILKCFVRLLPRSIEMHIIRQPFKHSIKSLLVQTRSDGPLSRNPRRKQHLPSRGRDGGSATSRDFNANLPPTLTSHQLGPKSKVVGRYKNYPRMKFH